MATTCQYKSGSEAADSQGESGAVTRFFTFLARAGEVARQRRALMQLGDVALKDFGCFTRRRLAGKRQALVGSAGTLTRVSRPSYGCRRSDLRSPPPPP